MKTARRHELHTNELAQQIEDLVAYSQKYGWQILAGLIAVVVIAVAAYLYTSSRRADAQRAWAELIHPQAIAGATPAEQITYFRTVADRNVDPLLSALALFQAGNVALGESTNPKTGEQQRTEWLRQAEEIFQQVVRDYARLVVPASSARLSLGIVAENRGDVAAAREIYQQLLNDTNLTDMPAQLQARYRLHHLKQWQAPVVFPPPLPTTAPTTATAPAESAADTQPIDLNPFKKQLPSRTDTQPTEADATTPAAATTQPAGG